MKSLVVLAAVLSLTEGRYTPGDDSVWADFKATYGKRYEQDEEPVRRRCFENNLERIEEANRLDDDAHYSINAYADMCQDSFKVYHSLQMPANRTLLGMPFPEFSAEEAKAAAESSIDWVEKGAVTNVKQQGQCGSCWAFSSTGNMEGAHFMETGELLSLSEQELVSCSNPSHSREGSQGCRGGLMDFAFDWVSKHGGISTEQEYPYSASTAAGDSGTCKKKLEHIAAKFNKGFVDLPKDEDQMAAYVLKHGPVSVAVAAGPMWQFYHGGIKRRTCFAGQLDHGVLIVGFGQEKGIKYWKVKNSWGTGWGESGYIRLHRGNNCNGIKESPCSIKHADGS